MRLQDVDLSRFETDETYATETMRTLILAGVDVTELRTLFAACYGSQDGF